jgi:hypothetical protein
LRKFVLKSAFSFVRSVWRISRVSSGDATTSNRHSAIGIRTKQSALGVDRFRNPERGCERVGNIWLRIKIIESKVSSLAPMAWLSLKGETQ